ncbi:nickel pincer cofactor biosynthesis protein LarC [Clostridium niameyense]|uniref:Pyridinium-3,5-bisthiocarboxylic acid mononucleotide nickel insertion protein n=1 Tax=Clostridium niameyense TaxID=1622073 RepID=A0A6M0RAU0_9CLOT|nr:nickel pincer cofactor biosynthesis protein LarC [Clostridium niameyense]NEZ47383.1 nickel pincer cofactor biosynthesis protein LarC [Clostridium niameyense]
MSKILYYDCFSGISGDMNLGALISLGVSEDYLIKELSKLNINNEFKIKVNEDERKGISGIKADVILTHSHEHNYEHNHEHCHEENQHNHSHKNENCHDHHSHGEHEHDHQHSHNHQHRNLNDINKIIDNSILNDNIKRISKDIFLKVAEAESKVHNKSLEEVHFHEVGATDSIVDIVGAAICLDYLKVDKIMCSKVEVGSGFVKCAHGTLPVPAPATTEILKDVPVTSGNVPFEATTPTGAAIIKSIVNKFTNDKDFKIIKTGYGIGGKDEGDIPNALRVFLAEDIIMEKENTSIIMECNIDDMNPEFYEYVMDKLFDVGASDVYFTPIIMKKTRPAVKLSVLTNVKFVDKIEEIILKETTTLGIRKYKVEKVMLNREIEKLDTKYGKIDIKNSYYKGEIIKRKPEYEDCKKISLENKVPIREVYKEVYKNLK